MKKGLLAILCAILFGCEKSPEDIPYDKDEAEYKWGEWGSPKLISIADDSLAVLAIYKPYFKEWQSCGLSCNINKEFANYRVGLFLVNYREKQKPILGDTLEYNLTIVKDYFRDSSVLVFDRDHNKFGFWKIGTNSVELVDYVDNSGKENREYVNYNARLFTNGNIFLFDPDADRKFLLETESGYLNPIEFSEEYEWLTKCVFRMDYSPPYDRYSNYANISYIGGELSCINANAETKNFELIVNNVIMDSLSESHCCERIVGWYGNYIKNWTKNKVYKIDTLNFKFDNTYADMLLTSSDYNPGFYNQNGNSLIRYSAEDLFEISNEN